MSRTSVWTNTAIILLLYLLSIWAVTEFLIRPRLRSEELALALGFALVQVTIILAILIVLLTRKYVFARKHARTQRLASALNDALARYAIGDDRTAAIRSLYAASPEDVEKHIFICLETVSGTARDRLVSLAHEFGFVDKWRTRCRTREPRVRATALQRAGQFLDEGEAHDLVTALAGEKPLVRLQAARALIRLGGLNDLRDVFFSLPEQTYMIRAIITEELEVHAATIARNILPQALESDDPLTIIAGLDLLRAWRRTVSVPGLNALVHHESEDVRERVFQAAPYVLESRDFSLDDFIGGLRDESPLVRAAAAEAAAKLGVRAAADALEGNVLDEDVGAALAAVAGLASLGQDGLPRLQRLILGSNRRAAALAFEAMEKQALGRVDLS